MLDPGAVVTRGAAGDGRRPARDRGAGSRRGRPGRLPRHHPRRRRAEPAGPRRGAGIRLRRGRRRRGRRLPRAAPQRPVCRARPPAARPRDGARRRRPCRSSGTCSGTRTCCCTSRPATRPAARFAEARGFTYRASLYWMERPADDALPGAGLPARHRRPTLGPGRDAIPTLVDLANTTFADHPTPVSWTEAVIRAAHEAPDFDPADILLAGAGRRSRPPDRLLPGPPLPDRRATVRRGEAHRRPAGLAGPGPRPRPAALGGAAPPGPRRADDRPRRVGGQRARPAHVRGPRLPARGRVAAVESRRLSRRPRASTLEQDGRPGAGPPRQAARAARAPRRSDAVTATPPARKTKPATTNGRADAADARRHRPDRGPDDPRDVERQEHEVQGRRPALRGHLHRHQPEDHRLGRRLQRRRRRRPPRRGRRRPARAASAGASRRRPGAIRRAPAGTRRGRRAGRPAARSAPRRAPRSRSRGRSPRRGWPGSRSPPRRGAGCTAGSSGSPGCETPKIAKIRRTAGSEKTPSIARRARLSALPFRDDRGPDFARPDEQEHDRGERERGAEPEDVGERQAQPVDHEGGDDRADREARGARSPRTAR